MVKKLFKHEITSYLRLWLPAQAVLFAIAIFMRILLFFENDGAVFGITFGSSVFLYAVAIIAAIGITEVFAIVRFYKNLFTHEGYLSFTLPVSPFQHIFAKVGTAVLFSVLTFVAILVSAMIVTSGEMLVEIFRAMGYMLKEAFHTLNGFHLTLYGLELTVCTVISMAGTILFYYTCIAIGQMAKKNRVLAAFGVYFGFYVLSQIISTVFTIVLALFPNLLENLLEDIALFAESHPYAFVHLLFISMTLISAAVSALYFFITHLIIRKKLNLE